MIRARRNKWSWFGSRSRSGPGSWPWSWSRSRPSSGSRSWSWSGSWSEQKRIKMTVKKYTWEEIEAENEFNNICKKMFMLNEPYLKHLESSFLEMTEAVEFYAPPKKHWDEKLKTCKALTKYRELINELRTNSSQETRQS